MNENQIISKIKLLKQVRPDRDWVISTKVQILKQRQGSLLKELSFSSLFSGIGNFRKMFQPAVMIPALLILVIAGFFIFANNLPEEPELAQNPLEQARVIAPAIEELQLAIAKTTEGLKNIEIENPETILEINKVVESVVLASKPVISRAQELVKDIELEMKEQDINQDAKKKGLILAVQVEKLETAITEFEKSPQEPMARIVEGQINNLRDRTLTEEQEELLEQAEQYFQKGKYNQALQILLLEI